MYMYMTLYGIQSCTVYMHMHAYTSCTFGPGLNFFSLEIECQVSMHGCTFTTLSRANSLGRVVESPPHTLDRV